MATRQVLHPSSLLQPLERFLSSLFNSVESSFSFEQSVCHVASSLLDFEQVELGYLKFVSIHEEE